MNNRPKGFIKSAKTVGKVFIKTTGKIVSSMLEEETCQAKGCNKTVQDISFVTHTINRQTHLVVIISALNSLPNIGRKTAIR